METGSGADVVDVSMASVDGSIRQLHIIGVYAVYRVPRAGLKTWLGVHILFVFFLYIQGE